MDTEENSTKLTSAPATAIAVAGEATSEHSDEVLRRLDKKLAPRIQAFRDSERLSEEDFAIRINVRD